MTSRVPSAVRAETREMAMISARAVVVGALLLAFVVIRAVVRLLRRRANRAHGLVHERVQQFLEG